MKHSSTKLFVGAASALTFAAPVSAQLADNTYQWASFEDIDVDRSGYIDDGEYKTYAFGRADWDNDGYLEDTEWAKYTEIYFDPWEMEHEAYVHYDTDGDGFIDRSEFNDVPLLTLYDAWDHDHDGKISDSDWTRVTAQFYDSE